MSNPKPLFIRTFPKHVIANNSVNIRILDLCIYNVT